MMIAVNHDVNLATGGEQAPWENSSLTQQVYLAGEGAADASPEAALWRLAAPARDGDLLEVYLQRYPGGPHAGDVRSLVKSRREADAPTQGPHAPRKSSGGWRSARASRRWSNFIAPLSRRRLRARRRGARRTPRGVARLGERPRHRLRPAGDPSQRRHRERAGRRYRDAQGQRDDGDRRLRTGGQAESRLGALSGAARPRRLRRRAASARPSSSTATPRTPATRARW